MFLEFVKKIKFLPAQKNGKNVDAVDVVEFLAMIFGYSNEIRTLK